MSIINVNVTNALAQAIGTIARNHEDRSIQIEWREGSPESEWIVTASDGTNDTVYVVDDESGTHMALTSEEIGRLDQGLSIMGDVRG